jgi:hypothetical protein
MRRLNSWKRAALAAAVITTGLIYGCVNYKSAAAENAGTAGIVNAVPSTPVELAVATQTNFTFTKPTPLADKSDNPGIGTLPWGVR